MRGIHAFDLKSNMYSLFTQKKEEKKRKKMSHWPRNQRFMPSIFPTSKYSQTLTYTHMPESDNFLSNLYVYFVNLITFIKIVECALR